MKFIKIKNSNILVNPAKVRFIIKESNDIIKYCFSKESYDYINEIHQTKESQEKRFNELTRLLTKG